MLDARTGTPRQPTSTLSLRSLLHSLNLNIDYQLNNAGNDAFACLLALQLLVDAKNTKIPPTPRSVRPNMTRSVSLFGPTPITPTSMVPSELMIPPVMPATQRAHSASPRIFMPVNGAFPFPPTKTQQGARARTKSNNLASQADEDGRITQATSASLADRLSKRLANTTIG
jgi:hypothetical protein